MLTPPPPMWGDEESDYGEFEDEPFYDPDMDDGRVSRTKLHLDSRRATKRAQSDG
jgi:hypothetical protein